MRPDIARGRVFPDYELPDNTGTPRRLCELQGEDLLILTLARGHYRHGWNKTSGPEPGSLGNEVKR